MKFLAVFILSLSLIPELVEKLREKSIKLLDNEALIA